MRVAYATAAQVITIANTGPLSDIVDPSPLVLLCALKFRVFIFYFRSKIGLVRIGVIDVASIQWPLYILDYIKTFAYRELLLPNDIVSTKSFMQIEKTKISQSHVFYILKNKCVLIEFSK